MNLIKINQVAKELKERIQSKFCTTNDIEEVWSEKKKINNHDRDNKANETTALDANIDWMGQPVTR